MNALPKKGLTGLGFLGQEKAMHELGLCNEMVHTLEDLMKKEKLLHIEEITVEIGEITGVLPRYMEECWGPASEGTKLAGSKLKIEFIQAKAHCKKCGKSYLVSKYQKCPFCGSEEKEFENGFEFEITQIKGE